MSKAVITVTQEGDSVDINVEFDPPVDNTDGALNPVIYSAALSGLQLIVEELKA